MELVTLDKENPILITTQNNETIVTSNNDSVLVTDSKSSTVSIQSEGNIVVEEIVSDTVVQGGVQGPRGIPGQSLQFEYVVAGQALGGNRAVTVNSSGLLVYPDLTSPDSRIYGITTHSAAAGELVTVQIAGTQTEPSWSWTTNLPVFVLIDGILSQIPPNSGQVLVVGYAQSPTKVFIDKQPPIFMG